MSVAEFKKILKEEQDGEEQEKSFAQKNLLEKAAFLVTWPLEKLQEYTIPCVEEEKMLGSWTWIYPITTSLIITFMNSCKSALCLLSDQQGGMQNFSISVQSP